MFNLQLNAYTTAISSVNKIVIKEWLRLNIFRFLRKAVISNPWECLCVDLIGPYTLKGDNSQIDFMALTMIDPASSWFEIVELPLVRRIMSYSINGKELLKAEDVFDKSSGRIAKLVNKTWLCRYPRCWTLIYDNGSEFKLHIKS